MSTKKVNYAFIDAYTKRAGRCTNGTWQLDPYDTVLAPVRGTRKLTITYGSNWADWRSRIRKGLNATTYMNVSGLSRSKYKDGFFYAPRTCRTSCAYAPNQSTGSWDAHRSGQFAPGFPGTPSTTFVSSLLNDAEDHARGQWAAKLRQVNTKMLGGEFLHDLERTIESIRHPAKNLFRRIGAHSVHVRNVGRRIRKRDRKEFLANTWLEAQYGWLPLMSDVKAGAEALADWQVRRNREHPTTRVVVGRGTLDKTLEYTNHGENLNMGGYLYCNYRWNRYLRGNVRYMSKVSVLPLSTSSDFAHLFGLNFGSWAPTVWEWIPYSFLIDYFTNIGTLISLHSVCTSNVLWTQRTAYLERETELAEFSKGKTLLTLQKLCIAEDIPLQAPELAYKAVLINRNLVGTPDHNATPLRFKLPGVGSMRWLNIGALLKARLTDKSFARRWL